VKLIAMAFVTLLIDWRLGIVALSVAPLLSIQALIYERRVGGKYKDVKHLESSAFRVVHESLSIIRVVKAFVQERAEEQRFLRRSTEASDARVRLGYMDGIFGLAVNLTTSAGMAMVLYVGIRNVQHGVLTLGSLLLVITYLIQLYGPLQNITYHLASLKASSASVERALDVFTATPETTNSNNHSRGMTRRAYGSIEFENVTFAYGSASPILENFSFVVPEGARVGLVGRTGAGKTTLVNLLVRFLSPQSGRILLDGRDIQHIELSELRRQFAFVLQEPVLFSTTISQNIAYGNPDAAHEEIVRAAIAAKAHDFILKLPQGYETNVGERGSLLSGGERQRVSIARAFLIDAPILILDEPTSSIDVNTEAEVLKATERLSDGRTSFFVSHRLGTLSNCDFLFRLRQGAPLEVCVCDPQTDFESLLRDDHLETQARVHLV
jgi:ATP-binding cassette subfamily B protein